MRLLLVLMPLLLAGCVVDVSHSGSGSSMAPAKEIVLVDRDFTIPVGQGEVSLPFRLDAPAENSHATIVFKDTVVGSGLAGPGRCSGGSDLQAQTQGSNSYSTSCGALPAGDSSLILRAQGPASGHAKLVAWVRG